MNDWKKIESDVFNFDEEGDSIEGELLSIETGVTYGNEVYKIKTNNGHTKTIFSTAVLQTKMQGILPKSIIRIVFMGVQESKKKNYAPMKLFDVYVKD